jgi:hypothetical protein
MMAAYPVAVFQDRYGGVYSNGAWIAIAGTAEAFPTATN